jgi:hypothetical protein
MNRVPYYMGRIAFSAGEEYDPASDAFFMAYMAERVTAVPSEKEKLYASAGSEWRTGWMEAKKEASAFFKEDE